MYKKLYNVYAKLYIKTYTYDKSVNHVFEKC